MPRAKVVKKKKKEVVSDVVDEIKKEGGYKIVLKILGKSHEAFAYTLADALQKLSARNCKGRGILIVEHNGIKKEKILMPSVVYRLMNSQGLSREVNIKNISTLFGI